MDLARSRFILSLIIPGLLITLSSQANTQENFPKLYQQEIEATLTCVTEIGKFSNSVQEHSEVKPISVMSLILDELTRSPHFSPETSTSSSSSSTSESEEARHIKNIKRMKGNYEVCYAYLESLISMRGNVLWHSRIGLFERSTTDMYFYSDRNLKPITELRPNSHEMNRQVQNESDQSLVPSTEEVNQLLSDFNSKLEDNQNSIQALSPVVQEVINLYTQGIFKCYARYQEYGLSLGIGYQGQESRLRCYNVFGDAYTAELSRKILQLGFGFSARVFPKKKNIFIARANELEQLEFNFEQRIQNGIGVSGMARGVFGAAHGWRRWSQGDSTSIIDARFKGTELKALVNYKLSSSLQSQPQENSVPTEIEYEALQFTPNYEYIKKKLNLQ